MSILGIVLLLPLIGFFLVLWAPTTSKLPFTIAFGTTIVTFLTSLGLIGPTVANAARFNSEVNRLWVDSPNLQIRLHLGVDGLNLWLVLLTTLLLPIGVWISQSMIKSRNKNFYALLLLFQFGLDRRLYGG